MIILNLNAAAKPDLEIWTQITICLVKTQFKLLEKSGKI